VGLTERVAHAAARRPHVLLVPVPGQRPLRWAAEDVLDERGWARAASPAGADVLLCCGEPGPELADHVEVAWEAMPGPRVRVVATALAEVRPALLTGAARLSDLPVQRRDARDRSAPPLSAAADPAAEPEVGHDMDHSMDMGMGMDMDMGLPGGLQMAGRVQDRDGLRLEGLNLSLGPLLPGWPGGLRLDVVLSGDVLTRADVVRLDRRPEPGAPPSLVALDALAMLLDAAGWTDGALRARRARATGASGPPTQDLLRRLRRARLLRWSLRGLPAPGSEDLVAHLDRLVDAVHGAGLPVAEDSRLARDVVGLDVGTASLVVAAHSALEAVGAGV